MAISYHKFKSVHPIIEKDDKEKLKDIEVSTSDESEDGWQLWLIQFYILFDIKREKFLKSFPN